MDFKNRLPFVADDCKGIAAMKILCEILTGKNTKNPIEHILTQHQVCRTHVYLSWLAL